MQEVKKMEKNEYCPVELAMQLINKKWIIQLIRDMFFGKSRFNEFKEDKPNLSNKVLSNCLNELEENELITSEEKNDIIEYKLTKKGQSLNKIIYELAMFTLDNDLNNIYFDEEKKEELRILFRQTLL